MTLARMTRAETHRHPMRVVTRHTGISAELLRVWERRYRLVKPARTQTGRRLYSDAEIARLHLLYRATLGGRSIGAVAALPNDVLEEMVRQDAEAELARHTGRIAGHDPAAFDSVRQFVDDSLNAVDGFDPAALGAILRRAAVALPATVFLERVVASLLQQVGARWREGRFRPVHGHLTATIVRHVLEQTTVVPPAPAPKLIVATVTGQLHELGALIAAAAAAADGWSVTWLGANLPASDIAEAAEQWHVRAVGISLIHPVADAAAIAELRRLRTLLPRHVELLVGGSAAASYAAPLHDLGIEPIQDLTEFQSRLQQVVQRSRARRPRVAARKTHRLSRKRQ